MSLTGTELLRGLSDYIGDLWESTTTAIGGVDGLTITDTLTQRWGRDAALDGYVRLTSGSYTGEIRRVSSFDDGVFTVSPAFGGQVASGTSYEFHRYDPSRKFSALDRARIMAYPQLAVVEFDDSITADGQAVSFEIPASIRKGPVQVFQESRLVPNDPQNFLATPRMESTTGWTAATLTAAVYTRSNYDFIIPKYGENYCTKLSGSAGTYSQLVASMTGVTAADAAGRKMTFGVWAFCLTASSLRVSITDDSGTTYSSYHGGTGWEFVQVTDTISNTNATLLTVGIATAVADTLAQRSGTADGTVESDHPNIATARSGVNLVANTTATSSLTQWTWSGADYIGRYAFFIYDTSSLGASTTITAAVYTFYGTGTAEADTNGYNAEVRYRDFGGTVTTADWFDPSGGVWSGLESGGSFDVTSWNQTAEAANDFSDSGVYTSINKTGNTMVVLGLSGIESATPTGTNRINFRMADLAGTTSDPLLTVTHSAASRQHKFLTILGVG